MSEENVEKVRRLSRARCGDDGISANARERLDDRGHRVTPRGSFYPGGLMARI
jgi:hypothetical protein